MAGTSAAAGRRRPPGRAEADRAFLVGLPRAFAGALIFALPMLMTMELWWIGFYIDPLRLIVLMIVLVPLLAGLARFSGFKQDTGPLGDVADAFVAIAVAAAMATVILFLLKVITFGMPAQEIIGKIALQTFPGSIGAMLARAQTGEEDPRQEEARKHPSYGGEMFLMAAGALFLSLNVAPTEEIILLSYRMEPLYEIALIVLSLVLMHGFVYAVDFPGGVTPSPEATFWGLFLRFTVVGYVIVLLISLYILWTFGRTTGSGFEEILSGTIVLSFPGSIGAAAARLIL